MKEQIKMPPDKIDLLLENIKIHFEDIKSDISELKSDFKETKEEIRAITANCFKCDKRIYTLELAKKSNGKIWKYITTVFCSSTFLTILSWLIFRK